MLNRREMMAISGATLMAPLTLATPTSTSKNGVIGGTKKSDPISIYFNLQDSQMFLQIIFFKKHQKEMMQKWDEAERGMHERCDVPHLSIVSRSERLEYAVAQADMFHDFMRETESHFSLKDGVYPDDKVKEHVTIFAELEPTTQQLADLQKKANIIIASGFHSFAPSMIKTMNGVQSQKDVYAVVVNNWLGGSA